jgi:hypothetical protein
MVQTITMLASPATDMSVAIGTSAAAAIALATLAFLCYQWAKDRRERRILEEQKQAARINCWFIQISTDFSDSVDKPEFRITGKLEWLNRSDDPVYSVLVLGNLATQEVGGFPLGRKRQPVASSGYFSLPAIAPGSNGFEEFTWTFNIDRMSTLLLEFVLSWQFNDARGVTWLKNSRGLMEKLEPSPEARNAVVAAFLPVIQDFAKEATDVANEVKDLAKMAAHVADELQAKADEAMKSANPPNIGGDTDMADKPYD